MIPAKKTILHDAPVVVFKDDNTALQSPNTHLVSALLTCGAKLAPKGFLETVEEVEGKMRPQSVWLMEEGDITFGPVAAETISVNEARRRWQDLEWCAAHPDHPIAYLRFNRDNTNRMRDVLTKKRPHLKIARGGRTALISADATPSEKRKMMDILAGK